MKASITSRPSLVLIDGGGHRPSPWRDLPNIVIGRSPFGRDQPGLYRFAQHDLQKDIENCKYQPVFSAWSLIFGRVPPLPNASKITQQLDTRPLMSIRDAHACFRGLKRPLADDNHGFDVYSFITKPEFYVRHKPALACQGEIAPVAAGLVFVTHVRIDVVGRSRHKQEASSASGVITHWGFVEASPNEPLLPIDFEERYRKQAW
ncbi:hypothetical protein [Bosea sp. (in: a-proteobacteria)]|uniref:hypothetical protein n=1 Tax=Bosea sp. (in: a-proteobacteria) TaxID=1871050 RepID=UPI0027367771|nr:hypothetical protein [Bosea sp. (in: a-proteobacteria)]MDP3406740.1 hypothetical protein [Bosea sp. (in: a-proteobacteria)]